MKRILIFLLVLATIGTTLAFAGGGSQSKSGAASAGGVPGDGQPFGKYDPPITVYSTKGISTNFPFEEGDSVDKNPWLQYNKDVLGIDVKWKWVDTGSDESPRMTTAIASGDLPDIFGVNFEQFNMLANAGLIWDLTEIYETYASPILKNFMEQAPLQAQVVYINNRMFALPSVWHRYLYACSVCPSGLARKNETARPRQYAECYKNSRSLCQERS